MAEQIPTPEASKLEWGPELGQISWDDAQEKIVELNAKLAEGEKPWRLPTKDELVAEFEKTGSTPIGFQSGSYWSNTTHLGGDSEHAYVVYTGSNTLGDGNKVRTTNGRVRLVR